jgi:hypothetical protein
MARCSYVIWLICLGIAGTVIAVGSAYMQRAGLSPIVLSSLLVGAVLGSAAVGNAWLLDVRNRGVLLLGTVIAGIFVATAQHAMLHRLSVHDWQQAQVKEPQLALFREPPPEELRVYLQQESAGGRMWLWLLDGSIIMASAVAIVTGVRICRSEDNIEEHQLECSV